MPEKVWDTQADFTEGTFVGCEATVDGKVVLSTGYTEGTWTSQVYEALSWQWWAQFWLTGTRPAGTNVYFRVRSGTTSAACLAAPWTPYFDGMTDDGRIDESLRVYYLNNPTASVGAFIQVQVLLEAS